MKKSYKLFALLAAVLTFACTPAEVPEPVEKSDDTDPSVITEDPGKTDNPAAVEYREVTLTAEPGDVAAKSSRDAAGKFYWSAGDEISVFRGTGTPNTWKMTSTNTEPEAHAQFTGKAPVSALDNPDGGKYYAVYPYSEENSFDGTYLTTTVPTAQVAAAGTFADGQFISIGCSDNLSMTFYHLCGGIKFSLNNTGITSVTLRGNNNEIIAGKVQVAIDANGHPQVNSIIEGSKEITLTCAGGFQTGVDYFFVTLPVAFTYGFTVDFGNGKTRTILNYMTVNRAKFQRSQNAIDYIYDETCDIENAGVRSYLESTSVAQAYNNDPDYTLSRVSNFSGKDKPEPVKLTWTGGNASQVLLSTSPDFSNPIAVSGTTSPVSVYNLIPGQKYYYKIIGNNNSVLKSACVTPVGPLRMIYIPNYNSSYVRNIRDLGGWPADGGHIAYGKLYRGSRLDDIQNSGNSSAKNYFLNTLGVRIDIDLRGLPPGSQGGSGEHDPWYSTDPIEYHNIKLWHYLVYGPNQYDNNITISTGESSDQYQYAIRQIIGWLGQDKPVYFHCHGGSDRTGTLAFLIEALLGVSELDLCRDYEVTYYSGSERKRDGSKGWYYPELVKYIRTLGSGTISDRVKIWAKTRFSNDVDPLTDAEIDQLRSYMIATD